MLIFDQLKKNDPQLRIVAVGVLVGLLVLLVGLWWVQIVSTREFQAHLDMQSYRTVRVPAVRGKILDRNGIALAENLPTYNVSFYLDELRKEFDAAYTQQVTAAKVARRQDLEQEQRRQGRTLSSNERSKFTLSSVNKDGLRQIARWEVASNMVFQISQRLGSPVALDFATFQRHYATRLALPFPVATNLSPVQVAIFSEQCAGTTCADLEIQSMRYYPFTNTAAHVLGSLQRDESSQENEDAYFSYRQPDYRGKLGIEYACDKYLHGRAGVKSYVVNSLGYRQVENTWQAAEPGSNVVLTIDLRLQRKAERALQVFGSVTRGAFVIMDVHTGDILAMASSPSLNPNDSLQPLTAAEATRRLDKELTPERNRATQDRYAPGSIFKTIVGLACLEAGLDPNESIYNPGFYQGRPGTKPIHDLAPPGNYNFKEALAHSSNTYFIMNGLRTGILRIIQVGQRLHLTEGTGLGTQQENKGIFPDTRTVSSGWQDGETANISIGQGQIAVTPLQMAVMVSALANGGKVLWPRLVDRIEAPDPLLGEPPTVFEKGRIHDDLGVKPENLKLVRDAMLADTQEAGATGTRAAVPGLDICGKTGTAQISDPHGKVIANTAWFASFAPYASPRYAVVVMVELAVNDGSGGKTCAPIAANIYKALMELERAGTNATQRMASVN